MRRHSRPLACIVLVTVLGGCRPEVDREPARAAVGPAAPAARPNVVLVLVDTLRADHLSAYGYSRPTSPNLEALAGKAVLFEQARAQASCTFPSVNSLLTSRDPLLFLGQEGGRLGIPEGIPSLAQTLRDAGYSTAAVSASPVVRKSPTRFNPAGGFDRGFEVFDEQCLWQAADCVNGRVEALLPALEEPYFLYLHYMEPHGPYRPPQRHPRRWALPIEAPEFVLAGDPNPLADAIYKQGKPAPVTEAQLAHLVDLYDEEIAFFDSELPRLLAALEGRSRESDTVLALASDHGEAFLEHGDVKHCHAPFDTQVRTPLLLRAPGAAAGRRVSAAVSNLDLAPTLLDLAGVDREALTLDGESLRPWLEPGPAAGSAGPRWSFSSQGAWRSATDGRTKLLYDMERRSFALFDLAADPGELRDLARERPAELQRLQRALYERLVRVEGSTASERSLALGEEAEERLRALGYLQ